MQQLQIESLGKLGRDKGTHTDNNDRTEGLEELCKPLQNLLLDRIWNKKQESYFYSSEMRNLNGGKRSINNYGNK